MCRLPGPGLLGVHFGNPYGYAARAAAVPSCYLVHCLVSRGLAAGGRHCSMREVHPGESLPKKSPGMLSIRCPQAKSSLHPGAVVQGRTAVVTYRSIGTCLVQSLKDGPPTGQNRQSTEPFDAADISQKLGKSHGEILRSVSRIGSYLLLPFSTSEAGSRSVLDLDLGDRSSHCIRRDIAARKNTCRRSTETTERLGETEHSNFSCFAKSEGLDDAGAKFK